MGVSSHSPILLFSTRSSLNHYGIVGSIMIWVLEKREKRAFFQLYSSIPPQFIFSSCVGILKTPKSCWKTCGVKDPADWRRDDESLPRKMLRIWEMKVFLTSGGDSTPTKKRKVSYLNQLLFINPVLNQPVMGFLLRRFLWDNQTTYHVANLRDLL